MPAHHRRLLLRPAISLAVLLSSASSIAAQETEPESEPESTPPASSADAPSIVHVGVYVNQIPAVRLKENEFTIDFWIWFRWESDELDPMSSFEVANGRIDSRSEPYRAELPDGMHYAAARVTATMTQFWDISRFPLDDHVLRIAIEDPNNEEFKVRFVADEQNSQVGPDVEVPGWIPRTGQARVVSQVYHTNYGDTSLPSENESIYSRFLFAVPIERAGYGYFLKLFFGLFIATGIAFTASFIKPTDLDPRFGLGIGAIFAAVASEYVVTSSLPDTNQLTMADKLHLLAFFFIFLSIVESTYSLSLFSSIDPARVQRSIRLDRCSFALMTLAYLTLSCLAVVTG
jgi:hypothetical protein